MWTERQIEHDLFLYGSDVYYAFSYYCFWRMIVRSNNPDWLFVTPPYFLEKKNENISGS